MYACKAARQIVNIFSTLIAGQVVKHPITLTPG